MAAGRSFHPGEGCFRGLHTLTGINLYTRLNSLRALMGQPPLDEPPPVKEVEALEAFDVLYGGPDSLKVSFSPTPVSENRALAIWATEPLNPGIAFVSHKLRLLTVVPPGTASPVDITQEYTRRYGAPKPGKAIYVAGELVSLARWKGPRSLFKVRLIQ